MSRFSCLVLNEQRKHGSSMAGMLPQQRFPVHGIWARAPLSIFMVRDARCRCQTFRYGAVRTSIAGHRQAVGGGWLGDAAPACRIFSSRIGFLGMPQKQDMANHGPASSESRNWSPIYPCAPHIGRLFGGHRARRFAGGLHILHVCTSVSPIEILFACSFSQAPSTPVRTMYVSGVGTSEAREHEPLTLHHGSKISNLRKLGGHSSEELCKERLDEALTRLPIRASDSVKALESRMRRGIPTRQVRCILGVGKIDGGNYVRGAIVTDERRLGAGEPCKGMPVPLAEIATLLDSVPPGEQVGLCTG